jgi:hypothetical protein
MQIEKLRGAEPQYHRSFLVSTACEHPRNTSHHYNYIRTKVKTDPRQTIKNQDLRTDHHYYHEAACYAL